jgi:hypothetical protein
VTDVDLTQVFTGWAESVIDLYRESVKAGLTPDQAKEVTVKTMSYAVVNRLNAAKAAQVTPAAFSRRRRK